MKIYSNTNLNKKHHNGVIAIGNFDGLHLGHQKVINEARIKARKNNLPFGIITFEPVPVMFFNSKIKNHRINSLKQKKLQLKKFKLDFLIIIKFNKNFHLLQQNNLLKNN
jgi:riboflavin kinase/FMN adenylyltransferase